MQVDLRLDDPEEGREARRRLLDLVSAWSGGTLESELSSLLTEFGAITEEEKVARHGHVLIAATILIGLSANFLASYLEVDEADLTTALERELDAYIDRYLRGEQ